MFSDKKANIASIKVNYDDNLLVLSNIGHLHIYNLQMTLVKDVIIIETLEGAL